MKSKKSISKPIKNMNRDAHISQLANTEYIFMLNGNTSNETGEGLNIQNEPSNNLGIVFPNNYKCIGFKNDLVLPRTYYFLTNIITKKSSIGYVDNNVQDTFNQDEESSCDDCSQYNQLSTPLEETTQFPSLEYVELINDNCYNVGEGLNFDINFPIKKIEIKQEKLGTTLYWNDNRNSKRYLNVSDVSYLFIQDIPCDDDITTECPNLDKLLVFPKHNKIQIEASEVQTGGNLKFGTYEFYVAYCDLLGNEMTGYSTPTNPISIFDENNNILSQTQTDTFTNFAIKLKVNNLNTSYFKYYKVVCVERNNVDNAQTAFIEGIHPTTDDTILYTHSGSSSDDFITRGNISVKRRIDFNKLNLIKPYYDKAETTMVSGGRLWSKGLTKREEINLQPVVNLFGAIALDWQTTIAKEDLYKSAIATSKYKGYQRDEVQPFGIRFFLKDGDYTAVFPIVGRPATSEEQESLIKTSGSLIVGKPYIIKSLIFGDNFDNVGYVGEGIPFVASDSVPNNWSNLTEVVDFNLSSVIDNAPNCVSTERNKVWQIYNTATQTGICDDSNSSTLVQETITKTCKIENVFEIPSNTINLPITEEFTDLKSYIEDSTSDISGITEYIEDEYDTHCEPFFIGDCQYPPNLVSSYNEIATVVSEVAVYNEKDISSYLRKPVPQYCSIYKKNTTTGEFINDTDFEDLYMPCVDTSNRQKVYIRDSDFTNEDCGYAIELLDNTTSSIGYFLNYDGSTTKADLLTAINVTETSANFENKLHKKALFFKADKKGRDKLILEISKTSLCQSPKDDLDNLGVLRYTVFNNCSDFTELGGDIITTTTGVLVDIDVSSYPEQFIIAIDSPIQEEIIAIDCSLPLITQTVFKIVPPCGCFGILTRDIEYTSIDVSWSSIILDKVETYESECTFAIPVVDDCEPKPYTKGKFAYWESTETYPDNNELYDSSNLIIRQNDFEGVTSEKITDFKNYFTNDVADGVYILKPETNLTCANIRHPKMPDNIIAPFLNDNFITKNFAETVIFPLGVTVDPSVIYAMLSVALNNGLITQKQYSNIEGYEILRGDNSIHKSVVASGLGFDMYKYNKDSKDWWYPNFPFNDLGEDKFNASTSSKESLIQHPFDSYQNHMFSFLSPDLALTKPSLPTELSFQGYQFGSANQSIEQVDEHPKYTILGSKAYNTAFALATAEVLLETFVKSGEMISRQWFTFGTSNGSSLGFAGSAIVTGIYAAQGFIKIGQYRYDWLKIFRDLGTSYNFAHMTVGVGEYNRFVTNYQQDSYLRALTVKKYLKSGDFNTVDSKDGSPLNINNKLREESVLLSTGDQYRLNYIPEYFFYDNNKISSNYSKVISSDLDCSTSSTFTRDVASPYFTLKNYVPDQWGTIDSIKWLTTNYLFKLEDFNECKPIFGGTICISPYSVRRKTPLFRKTGMRLPDKLPFNYSEYGNIGYPKYYIDYEVDTEYSAPLLKIPFPDIDSEYTFDCETGRRRFYVRPPSKFYLYSYGIVNFLVESEINCHFRYGRKEQKDRFYQKGMNVVDWVQETNLPISEPNTFFYNNTYSFPVSNTPYKYLDSTYNREIWQKRNIQPNAVIYSEMDNNENDLIDPWLVYKPLNWYEYKTSLGKLIDIKDIESMQFLARFENGLVLNNAIDNLADRITPQNKELGTAGLFAERPLEFKTTDLGFAGTQNTEICSTPFGHFWADAKRGKIFQLDQNGKNLEIISETVQGQPTNMKQWFREHLPFKILKYFPNADIDNKYKGLGLNMWWDDRFSRLFITKKDYIPKSNECTLKYEEGIGFYTDCVEEVISCSDGYTYNEETQLCEKTIQTQAICTEKIPFNFTNLALDTCGGSFVNFSGGSQSFAKCSYLLPIVLECGGSISAGVIKYIVQDIQIGLGVYALSDSANVDTSFNGNFVADNNISPELYPGLSPNSQVVITVVNGIITTITNFNDLPNCI